MEHDKHKLKILNKLGRGAWGVVYRGTYDGAQCAVKTLAVESGQDEAQQTAFKMFAREAQILKQCSHGRIIGFKSLCRLNPDKHDAGGKWALVLEYAKGGTLSDKVSQCMISPGSKVYSDAQALSWALDVASALEFLHLRSPVVLHRDVKLSNILLAKEEGQWVAKLSDFGLHVVADDQRERMLRVSITGGQSCHYYATPPITPRAPAAAAAAAVPPSQLGPDRSQQQPDDSLYSPSVEGALSRGVSATTTSNASGGGWSHLTQQHVQALQQQQLMQEKSAAGAKAAGGTCPGCGGVLDLDSAQQLRMLGSGAHIRCGRPGCTADHHYGEMHDSSGSVPYVGAAAGATGVRRHPPPRRAISFSGDSTAKGQQRRGGPRRSVSFRLASQAASADPSGHSSGYAAAGAAVAEAGGPDDHALWAEPPCFSDDNCSMVTDATWVSSGTCLTNTTGGSSDDDGSITEVETVFNMTGQTGSCMYMAPEICLSKPYNEKADVFSFGVVLYELMARCLLIFTELPTNSADPGAPERYAAKVAGGYRPPRPKRMSPAVWQLIEACWHQEPTARPSMSKVVRDLQLLLREEQQGGTGPSSRRTSFSTATASAAANNKGNGHTSAACHASSARGVGVVEADAVPSPAQQAGPVAAGCSCVTC